MAVSQKALSAALAVLGAPEEAVSPETVWEQTVRFYPASWKKRWPAELPLPWFLERKEPALSVSRQRLFEIGQSVETEEDAVNFYVAVCSWGAGTSALQISRSVRPLHEPGAPGRLVEGITAASTVPAAEGYALFYRSGPAKITGLGPSFFTKLLYFAAGQPSPSDTRHPLILDRRVAQSLGWKTTTGWTPADYTSYLDVVEAAHERWRPDLPTDVIEYTLFQGHAFETPPSI